MTWIQRQSGSRRNPSSQTIAVIGLGLVGRLAAEALAFAGPSSLHILDWPANREGRWPAWQPRGAHVTRHEAAGPWLDECDVCVVAADVPGPWLLELNSLCLRRSVPLVAGLAMGTVGQAGPVVRGGRGPCLRCVDIRLRAATGRSCLQPYGPPDRRIAHALAEALARWVGSVEDPDAAGHLTYHWADGAADRHSVLRSWRCPDCRHIDPQPAYRRRTVFEFRDRPPSDPEHILRLTARVVDPVTGPITSLDSYEPAPLDPPIRHAVSALVDEGWQRAGHAVLHCGGGGLTRQEAEAAALGEALERASAVLPPAGDFIRAPHRLVAKEAIDPRRFDLFHPRTRAEPGFPYPSLTADEPLSWTWGWSLSRRRPVLVPAARVFVPFESELPGDAPDYPMLSGFAAGNTLEEATLGALLEVIERDGFMIAWANRLPLRHVDFRDDDREQAATYESLFRQPGLEVRCGLVELDLGAPIAIAMVRSERRGDPAFVVAAAADVDPARACRRALRELSANRLNVLHNYAEVRGVTATPRPEEVRDEAAHGLLYADPATLPHVEHWWERATVAPLPEAPPAESAWARLSRLVQVIEGAGLEVLVVDLTAPEIGELGLVTVKVIVPGAYAMNFDSRWPQFGGVRITEAPVRAGRRARSLPFHKLNRFPHPFP